MGEEECLMRHEAEIKERYRAFYRAAIAKDKAGVETVLDPSFTLTHMTGMVQTRDEYIRYIQRGTLNYFSEEPVNLLVTLRGTAAALLAQSRVEAAVFGGGRHTWRLQLAMEAKQTSDGWVFTSAVASTF